MTTVWLTIAALSASTVAMRSLGPVAFGGRRLSGRVAGVIGLVAPALLAALVVFETLGSDGPGLTLDARLVGLAAAGLALLARLPLLAVVALSAVAAALTRAIG